MMTARIKSDRVKSTRVNVDYYLDQMEEMWRHFDALFADLDAQGWQQKHGPDWIFADLPYHLAYIDRELVIGVLTRGEEVAPQDRLELRSLRDMHSWNQDQFAQRPAGQTVARSLEQMHADRAQIRTLLASMCDRDLEGRIWFPMTAFRGWRTAELALQAHIIHAWNEFMQLRLHMRRAEPVPGLAITRLALHGFLGILSTFAQPHRNTQARFDVVWNFPTIGVWTLQLTEDGCTVVEGALPNAHLTFIQSPELFVKTFNSMHHPLWAMLLGRIKVRGWRHLGRFSKLYPPPTLDQVFEPIAL